MGSLLLACWLAAAAADSGEAAEEAAPDRGLLEFLGRYEDAEGNWVDPLSLEAPLPFDGADDDNRRNDDDDHDNGNPPGDRRPAPREPAGGAGDG